MSYNPRSGEPVATVRHTPVEVIDQLVVDATTSCGQLAAASPRERRTWIYAIAAELENETDDLARLADLETGLGLARLTGEVARAAQQLRFYADVAVEGSYLSATLDTQDQASASIQRVSVPLGPVAVFGASNFPFAFSVLGNDTASALAAGCSVIVKAHPAHPRLSNRLIELAKSAWQRAGGPTDALALVNGFEAGTALVQHPGITAVGFTGSQGGGLGLWRLANERDIVIPVYAEMGTVNPVVITPAAADQMPDIARGFVESFTLGSGQFCTKPGLLLAPAGNRAAEIVAEKLVEAAPSPTMLTSQIAESVRTGIAGLEAAGATAVEVIDSSHPGWSAPAAVLRASATDIMPGSRLVEEVFGPVVLVVEYDDVDEAVELLERLQGALAGSVFTVDSDGDERRLVDALSRKVGRVIRNGWPTGVAFTWAQHHGGPWPATSNPATTSVGAGALSRWVRPIAFQGFLDEQLPAALQQTNPWRITRRVDGTVEPGDS